MKEDGFRAWLVKSWPGTAVSDTMSNARRVEKTLRLDLDDLVVSAEAIEGLVARLRSAGIPANSGACCATAVRRYRDYRAGVEPKHTLPTLTNLAAVPTKPAFFAEATIPDLMRLYADLLSELRDRGVSRTANGPVGDYAEWLFSRAFGWTLAHNSAAHHDAIDAAGTRYQVKARRANGGAGDRQLGALRRPPEGGFDVLAAVLFDRDLQVLKTALIPCSVVIARAKRVEHTNSCRFMLSDDLWMLPLVRDATGALQRASRATVD